MEADAGTSSMRRAAAIAVIVLGGGSLWWLGSGGSEVATGNGGLSATTVSGQRQTGVNDPRLAGAHRFEDGGWIYVHLEGDPATIGFQHGYLLGPDIEDGFAAVSAGMMHESQRDWAFFRKAAHEMLWPKIDLEYQDELQGIVDGLRARTNSKLDVDDIVAMNALGAAGLLRALVQQTAECGACAQFEESGKLQRVCGDGKLDERRENRYGA